MANKTLFKSLIGRLMPAADALNEERAPAYALSPKHQLAQYAATGCLNTTFYASAREQRLQKICGAIAQWQSARFINSCRRTSEDKERGQARLPDLRDFLARSANQV